MTRGRKNQWICDKTPIDEIAIGENYFFSEMQFRLLRNYEDPPGEEPGIVRNKMQAAIVARCKYLDRERDKSCGKTTKKVYRLSDRWELKGIGYRTLKERDMNSKARHEFKYDDESKRGFTIWRNA